MILRILPRLVLALCALQILPAGLPAASFYLREHRIRPPEMGEILTYIWGCGKSEFGFVPPFDWRVGTEPERQRLVLTSKDRAANITVALAGPNPALAKGGDVEGLRSQILNRVQGARIVAEFPCYTSSHRGWGFDVTWTGPGGVSMTARVALLPATDGTLEFVLSTMSSRFPQVQAALGGLMTSFQVREGPELAARPKPGS